MLDIIISEMRLFLLLKRTTKAMRPTPNYPGVEN